MAAWPVPWRVDNSSGSPLSPIERSCTDWCVIRRADTCPADWLSKRRGAKAISGEALSIAKNVGTRIAPTATVRLEISAIGPPCTWIGGSRYNQAENV